MACVSQAVFLKKLPLLCSLIIDIRESPNQSVMLKGNNYAEVNPIEVSGAYFNPTSSFPCVSLNICEICLQG